MTVVDKNSIGSDTVVAGVIGRPARRSLSPSIHNAWITAAGLDAVYLPLAVQPDRFTGLMAALRGGSIRGLNVTVPFKEEALALCDQATAFANEAGAANLLVFEADGSISADNTDGRGLLAALAGAGWKPDAGVVVLLGAGGAAKGAAAALLAAGVPKLVVVNRTIERAQALAERLDAKAEVRAWSELADCLAQAALVVNATSLGMAGQPSLVVPLDRLPVGALVMDMVYTPLETPLLLQAKARGLRTVDGLAMLVAQAEPSFERFFGHPVPVGVDARAIALSSLGSGA